LAFIEEYIRTQIMPLYANSHTISSATGKQTTQAREDARALIKRVCGGNEKDAVIFTGAGTTHAVNLLVNKLHVEDKVKAFR
jgi:selenocysteine lyase/cysteine desulfurase